MITGVCETDFSGYPDCRDEFVKALNQAVTLGLARDIRFVTPLMWLNKAETWALADYYQQLDTVKTIRSPATTALKEPGAGSAPHVTCGQRAGGIPA